MRALRLRRLSAEFDPLPDVIKDAPVGFAGRPTDEQVQRAILEARALAFALLRLGSQARPELAWRCQKLGTAIENALKDTFGRMMQ